MDIMQAHSAVHVPDFMTVHHAVHHATVHVPDFIAVHYATVQFFTTTCICNNVCMALHDVYGTTCLYIVVHVCVLHILR